MSELIQTGWGNVHMYRLTRDIYILNRYGIVFFFIHLFFYAFNVIDTAHMTYEKDCSSFGRKTMYDVQVPCNSLNKTMSGLENIMN